jgi:zinc protease
MTVLVLEQHFLPIVEIHALVKTGSAYDPHDKAGVANLVASLLMRDHQLHVEATGGTNRFHRRHWRRPEDFTTASARTKK